MIPPKILNKNLYYESDTNHIIANIANSRSVIYNCTSLIKPFLAFWVLFFPGTFS